MHPENVRWALRADRGANRNLPKYNDFDGLEIDRWYLVGSYSSWVCSMRDASGYAAPQALRRARRQIIMAHLLQSHLRLLAVDGNCSCIDRNLWNLNGLLPPAQSRWAWLRNLKLVDASADLLDFTHLSRHLHLNHYPGEQDGYIPRNRFRYIAALQLAVRPSLRRHICFEPSATASPSSPPAANHRRILECWCCWSLQRQRVQVYLQDPQNSWASTPPDSSFWI